MEPTVIPVQEPAVNEIDGYTSFIMPVLPKRSSHIR